jgi:hypothetical protein
MIIASDLTAHTRPASATEPLRVATHVIVGIAIGLVAPFTLLAWPFALVVGIVVGKADAARLRGERHVVGDAASLFLAVAGGVLAMLFFGAVIGGLVAFVVVALAAFSERAAAFADATDQGVARILLFVVPVLMWVMFIGLGLDVDIRIGS